MTITHFLTEVRVHMSGIHITNSLSEVAGLRLDERTHEPCILYFQAVITGVFMITEKKLMISGIQITITIKMMVMSTSSKLGEIPGLSMELIQAGSILEISFSTTI